MPGMELTISPWKKTLKWTAWSMLIMACLAIGTIMGWGFKSEVVKSIFINKIFPTSKPAFSDSLTLLVLGCDVQYDENGRKIKGSYGRSDSMLVAKLDFKNKTVEGVSIPRDTRVSHERYGEYRINTFHVLGGTELAEEVVEDLLDVKIDRTVVVNFDAFEEMIDMLDGVEVDVPKRMRYVDQAGGLNIDLQAGFQNLNGDEAMGFVRYRLDSDFKRQDRQKLFLYALKDRVMERKVMIPKLTDHMLKILDDSFTPKELAELIDFSQKVGSKGIKLGMVPVIEGENYVLSVDHANLEDVLIEFGLHDSLPGSTEELAG
jgi:LCP family protein required for cell wall assembly